MEELKPFLKRTVEAGKWPGTELCEGTATVFRYVYGPECAEILKKATTALYGWVQPELPEDLCLLRDDEDPWLVSIAHERDSYFWLSDDERKRLFNALPELAALAVQE